MCALLVPWLRPVLVQVQVQVPWLGLVLVLVRSWCQVEEQGRGAHPQQLPHPQSLAYQGVEGRWNQRRLPYPSVQEPA